MSTTRKFAMSIFSLIVGIAVMALVLVPTAVIANSSAHSPESNPGYVADSSWSGPVSSEDFPWN